MKKGFFLSLCFIFLVSFSRPVQALDPKIKVMLTTAAYGTVGGALLGTASMAFGTSSRAIFQGASIGLYAGLLFGGYILYSHAQKPFTTDGQYPEDPDSPYGDDEGGMYDDYQRWNPYQAFEQKEIDLNYLNNAKGERPDDVPVYLDLLHLQF